MNQVNFVYDDWRSHPLALIFKDNRQQLPLDVKLLNKDSSRELWTSLFRNSNPERYFPDDHWYKDLQFQGLGVYWIDFYNANNRQFLTLELTPKVDYTADESIYFFHTATEAFQTNWPALMQNWLEFFEYDDESYIWQPKNRKLYLITPLGSIRVADVPIFPL